MEPELSMDDFCSNPNNPPPKVTSRFLRSLLRIYRSSSSASASASAERSRRIKRAAYASIASSAGARRAWSRALLRKLRPRPRPIRSSVPALPRRIRTRPTPQRRRRRRREADRAEAVLRKLVPGGAGMEYCRLLEEAADYARCLAAQVQLMKTVVDSFHR